MDSNNTLPGILGQKSALKKIRNYLAGQALGFTRDEALMEEILKFAFTRVYIEREKKNLNVLDNKDTKDISLMYRNFFKKVCDKYPTLFNKGDEILLGPNHIKFLHQELAPLRISDSTRDIIGDIYEAFIGAGFRGQEGQFFTPRNAVSALVDLVSPTNKDIIIDPACGAGGFLLESIKKIKPNKYLSNNIHGIDKDTYLARLAKLHLAIHFDKNFHIHCADSLKWNGNGFAKTMTVRRQKDLDSRAYTKLSFCDHILV